MSQYRVGAISVTNASAVVTAVADDDGFTGTFTGNVSAGDKLRAGSDVLYYTVASVDSGTQLTLTAVYSGSTDSQTSYEIVRDFTANMGIPRPNQGDVHLADLIAEGFDIIDEALALADATFPLAVASGGTGANFSTTVADRFLYTTGTGVFGAATVTSAARSILDDTTTAAINTTLGLGTGNSPTFTGLTLSSTLSTSSIVNMGTTTGIKINLYVSGSTKYGFGIGTGSIIYYVQAGASAGHSFGYMSTGDGTTFTQTAIITTDGYIRVANGSAATPSQSWTGDINTGWFSAGADQIGGSCGGTQIFTLTANGINNTQLGATTPATANFRRPVVSTSGTSTISAVSGFVIRATSAATLTMPASPTNGDFYTIEVMHATPGGTTIRANTGHSIVDPNLGEALASTPAWLTSSTQYATITLEWNSTVSKWIVTSRNGTWTVEV